VDTTWRRTESRVAFCATCRPWVLQSTTPTLAAVPVGSARYEAGQAGEGHQRLHFLHCTPAELPASQTTPPSRETSKRLMGGEIHKVQLWLSMDAFCCNTAAC
jgi:hypothetical protein